MTNKNLDFMEIVDLERYIQRRILKYYDLFKNGHITNDEYLKNHSEELEMLKKVKTLNKKIFDLL